ncbi:glycine receptor subunit alpha-2-like [Mizuhopecten yessoensis]|uniref:glycine receptor subunit alpha-2-like n=1 Tax=Mizuhopecten yessoensis TaxID=6573 RepID=UPI000B4579CA|nr:glycine receptor subunit alpha-2-like [Mizuhopecten yessoensis]
MEYGLHCESVSCSKGLIVLLLMLMHGGSRATREEFIQALLIDYDSRIQPNFENDSYTDVNVSLFINSVDSISEQTMDLKLNMFIQQEWIDERLQFYGLIDSAFLELDSKLIDLIWVPDLYVTNEKSASFHDVTVPNKMLHLYENGRIVYRLRASITAACPMKLHKYPLDSQVCALYIQSFAFTRNNLRFRWRKVNPIQTNENMELPQFELREHHVSECLSFGGDTEGNFTCIQLQMSFNRNIGYFVIQVYIPTILIVLLSWVSFWLSIDAVPARISLGILTVLTLTNQRTNMASSVPQVSYIKALDVWMAVCLGFVFAAMLEYALVNVMERKDVQKSDSFDPDLSKVKVQKRGEQIDRISRLAFPLVFLGFCALYWIVYTV